MGLGGVKVKTWCEKKSQTGPAQRSCHLQPPAFLFKQNTRFLSSNSWTFKQNSQHEKCRALRDESRHIKNLT